VESTDTNTKRVLVVEDEASIAEVCTRVLNNEGFQVKAVADGQAALSLLNGEDFAFILVDIRTPRMNGIELHRRLENTYPEMAKKVVFTTGDVLSTDIKRFLDEVQCLYLAKPFTPGELKAVAKGILNGRGRTHGEPSDNTA
jgi:DNA-binding response OmpR family regulator